MPTGASDFMLSSSLEKAGEVSVKNEMYLGIRDFNLKEEEVAITEDNVRFLSFRVGEIILVTHEMNEYGWFEGYRHNDPERICGVCHKSMIRRILFK